LTGAAADAEYAGAKAEVQEVRDLVADLGSVPTRILQSFAAQKGQDVAIEFRTGKAETLQIADVRGGTITGRRVLREGFIERPFVLADLSSGKRSGAWDSGPALGRPGPGLIAVENGDESLAASRFLGSGRPWGLLSPVR
jgi:hypothetical protein